MLLVQRAVDDVRAEGSSGSRRVGRAAGPRSGDATYVSYTSPTYGRLGSAVKWFGKTDDLIRWAEVVTCGNRRIAEYVESKGTRAVVIPTVVDTAIFCPRPDSNHQEPLTLGWIGTHSTYPFLESLFPVLEQLARAHRFRLKVVGSGRLDVRVPGVEVENLDWSLRREVEDFQSFDVGLYPITVGGSPPDGVGGCNPASRRRTWPRYP